MTNVVDHLRVVDIGIEQLVVAHQVRQRAEEAVRIAADRQREIAVAIPFHQLRPVRRETALDVLQIQALLFELFPAFAIGDRVFLARGHGLRRLDETPLHAVHIARDKVLLAVFQNLHFEHGVKQQVDVDQDLREVHVEVAAHVVIEREPLGRPVQPARHDGDALWQSGLID